MSYNVLWGGRVVEFPACKYELRTSLEKELMYLIRLASISFASTHVASSIGQPFHKIKYSFLDPYNSYGS